MYETKGIENGAFGRRKEQPSITISSNGNVRQYRIHPGVLALLSSFFFIGLAGYIAATAYLAFRDDLITGAIANQARMKHEYEDRIAALRSKVDRVTSRQLLDQQAIEAKVAELIRHQEMLAGRSGVLNGLIERAREQGVTPSAQPAQQGSPEKADAATDPVRTGSILPGNPPTLAGAGSFLRGSKDIAGASETGFAVASIGADVPRLEGVLDQINQVALAQQTQLQALTADARKRASDAADVLAELKIKDVSKIAADIGGPFVAADSGLDFEDLASELEETLEALDQLKSTAKRLPLGNPVPGARITSTFGNRVDPFLGGSAFHAGIDFAATTGTPVRATGSGTVIGAAASGGYGKLVEIDHGNGITSRFAHLSRILVKPGDKVGEGTIIGRVGSTGRSTGPHLHYEVRRNEDAANPARFLAAGKKLGKLL